MNQEVLVTLLDFTEVLISNREKIENTEDRNPNISNGVVEMDFDIQFGLCSNFMEFSYLSDSKYHNIPTEFFESWNKYSGISGYPVGDSENCYTIYCFNVYGKYDKSEYGQLRWELITHLNNQCKLILEKENV